MNHGLWLSRKNYLLTLIRRVSDGHGGDTPEFLQAHCQSVIDKHPGEHIEVAIARYTELLDQLRYYPERKK